LEKRPIGRRLRHPDGDLMSLLRTQVAAARDVATRCAQPDADRSDHLSTASVARDLDLLHQAVGDRRRTGFVRAVAHGPGAGPTPPGRAVTGKAVTGRRATWVPPRQGGRS
jgi:hypothetical protein